MFNFEKLEVYQIALEFASEIYDTTKSFPGEEKFGIVIQLRRAASSISANIAEGSSRSKKEFAHFLNIARGSVFECITFLSIALKQKYITNDAYKENYLKCEKISKMLSGLRGSLHEQ